MTPNRQDGVRRAVVELEQHVAAAGWDGPVRLFALINTVAALAADPALAQQLPAEVVSQAQADPEHLTAVEQDALPEAGTLSELLHSISWPATVTGAAVVVERLVMPPHLADQIPDDQQAAQTWVAEHPEHEELRLAAAVLRDGTRCCAVRSRLRDDDGSVATGPDLVPGLTEAIGYTLQP
jgi:hypothetical protein